MEQPSNKISVFATILRTFLSLFSSFFKHFLILCEAMVGLIPVSHGGTELERAE